jgi:6-phosphofructokinase 1
VHSCNTGSKFVLIPEISLDLYGPRGFRRYQEALRRDTAAVVAEEPRDLLNHHLNDASGNVKHKDIGIYLKEKIRKNSMPGFPFHKVYRSQLY